VCAAAAAPQRFAAAVGALLGDRARYSSACVAALDHARRHTLDGRAARAVAVYTELLAGRRR
jgi:hypothetical protein